MSNKNFQERVELFATLKSKYQVSDYEDSSLSSPLYLILRKVDLGIELIEFELNWLKEHGLYRIREFVLQDKAHREKVLKLEFSNLKHKYNATNYIWPWQTSSLYLILCKLDSGELLTDSEMKWLKDNHLHKTIAIAQEISHFIKLKAKYQAIKHQDSSHSSPLYPILKRVDAKEGLNDEDINWLKSNELVETLRVMEAQFAKLKAKYQATKHSDSSVSSPLYQILQNIDAGEPLSESEVNWLKEHDLIETLELVQEIEQKRHFAVLKMKYKATQYEDSSPSSHLYKVLKQIDSGTQLSDSNTQFLRKRKLTETLKLAVDKYAANLELKIKYGIQLSQADIDWLKQNAPQDKITSLVDMYVEQLAQSGNPLTTADIEWLKHMGGEDIVTLFQELKHYAVLTEKYDLSDSQYKPPSYHSRLYAILQKLDKGERLEPKDFAWLTGERLIYHDSKIFTTYHEIEATFYEQEYKRTRKKWNLVNASSHWRKAVQPERALKQTDNLKFDKIKDNRLKSALKTTRGGAFRDIDKLDKAEQCARQAIEYNPSSHHPYTLMGAICYERGQYSDGHYWFDEAIKRGASPRDQDAEIKRVLKNADKDKRKEIVEYLLKKDPVHYEWANTLAGALCYEQGQYSEGDYYFDEAIKHGASPRVQDAEIKRVLKNADKDKRKKVVEYLLKKDPVRYKWAKKYISTES